jgi:hypothetical protein
MGEILYAAKKQGLIKSKASGKIGEVARKIGETNH